MPDMQDFLITSMTSANVNVPRFRIECQITDSQTGAVLQDLTGANAIVFPTDLGAIFPTAAEKREFIDTLAHYLVRKKAGLN